MAGLIKGWFCPTFSCGILCLCQLHHLVFVTILLACLAWFSALSLLVVDTFFS